MAPIALTKIILFSVLLLLFRSQLVMADANKSDVLKFDQATSQIVTKIIKDNKNIKKSSPVILFAPYSGTKVLKVPNVPKRTQKKYHSIFEDSLIENGSGKLQVLTSDNFNVSSEASFKQADYILTSEIIREGETLIFNYRARSRKTRVVIDLVRISLSNLSSTELDDGPVGIPIHEALERAAERLISGSNDIKSLYFNFLKSEGKGFSTEFDQVFVQRLIQKLEERISNPLTQRKLSTVFHRADKLKLHDGAYYLTGTSRISGRNIYVNLTLKDKANRSASWSGYITRSSLATNLAFEKLNYKNVLEKHRSTDRQGILRLSLTTSFGNDPVLKIKDTWYLKVKVDKPAWLFCFYYMADEKTIQIYPNYAAWQHFGGPKIPRGEWISIPRRYKKNEVKVTFIVSEPTGYELIKCFATTEDITTDLPEQLLGRDAIDAGSHKTPPVMTNDIDKILSKEFRKHAPDVAEASIAVTVIRGK